MKPQDEIIHHLMSLPDTKVITIDGREFRIASLTIREVEMFDPLLGKQITKKPSLVAARDIAMVLASLRHAGDTTTTEADLRELPWSDFRKLCTEIAMFTMGA